MASKLALDSWIPPTGEKGLWFYAGLAALLLGNLLVSPFYTKPVNSLSYGVSALIALLAINLWPSKEYSGFDKFLWSATTGYIALVLVASILSISLKDSLRPQIQKIASSMRIFCDIMGTPKVIFSSVVLVSLVVFHRNSAREYIIIGIAWAVIIGLQPLENILDLLRRLRKVWWRDQLSAPLGIVVGHQIPDILLVRQNEGGLAAFGDTIVACSETGSPSIYMALDLVGFSEGRWRRAIRLNTPEPVTEQLGSVFSQVESTAIAVKADIDGIGVNIEECNQTWCSREQLIGLVAPNTDLTKLYIEIVRSDLSLEEGRLVEVNIGARSVIYQLINGLTREEILQQKNTRGFVSATAKKIGYWNPAKSSFEVVKWIPNPNAPVFLVSSSDTGVNKQAVGFFPKTNYPVSINTNSLVTHNTAILGILGSGKSFLAIELVERLIQAGVKVICLDLTNQYARELGPYLNRLEDENVFLDRLRTDCSDGRNNVNRNVEEGGSISKFSREMTVHFSRFLSTDDERRLLIYNPASFEVWRQDSKPYQDKASMATLTPTEITRTITESALVAAQALGMTDNARCCLVFEEAHSLIPEWNAVASEGDKTATNGTAKAILQGRKFGLGCIVVTQRTANVTKSILNQCNTVFALRVFDATGMEFLKNYIGEDYANVLSALEDRHAVVFGRASSCRDPVLVRLNDRETFLSAFRGA
ncbi:MAG: DUF87 domain-containing protein [Deltaproteobacteria bacterium]|nr:DUF87 domain-containing protein [Candidatus Zymogenaceae bacterium]